MQASCTVRHLWATALHSTPAHTATATGVTTVLRRSYHQQARSSSLHHSTSQHALTPLNPSSLHSHFHSKSVQSQQLLQHNVIRRHLSATHQHITPTTTVPFEGRTYQPTADIPMPNLHWNGRPRIAERSNIALVGPPGSGKLYIFLFID